MGPRLTSSPAASRPAVYSMEDWYIASQDAASITFRPSLKTLFRRLGITLVAAIVVAALATMRGELAALDAAANKGDIYAQGIKAGVWGIGGLAAAIGIVAPLSALWQAVTISRGVRGVLTVTARRVFSRTKEWPIDVFRNIAVIVQERASHPARGIPNHEEYLWRVGLVDQTGHWRVELQIDRSKTPPIEGRMPERTREWVEALRQVTRIPCSSSPVFIEYGGRPRLLGAQSGAAPVDAELMEWNGNRARHITTSFTTKTYHSLEEMPPELRARVMEIEGRAPTIGKEAFISEKIVITDSEGNTRTYNSVADLPPDIRARYDEALKKFMQE